VSDRPSVLFAHERRAVARAVEHVLVREGFSVQSVTGGYECRRALGFRRWDALVVDVALPQVPGYELCEEAKAGAAATATNGSSGANVVVFVSSGYRRTSYKRRPSRLYGADDYVEVHHLCDSLPLKLRKHLALPKAAPAVAAQDEARQQLRNEGDARMEPTDHDRLAALIVADVILYNGDVLHAASDLPSAEAAVASDLAIARELFEQILHSEGAPVPAHDPIHAAFARLVGALGRSGGLS
jgi:CheY-like chemotaxis protein